MALFVITGFIIILRRIISLVSIIIFNIIPGLFVMAFQGYYVGLTFGRGLSGGYKMRLAGRGIVDPVYAAISQRCFHTPNHQFLPQVPTGRASTHPQAQTP